jgi:HD superfamily phosphodiesterase
VNAEKAVKHLHEFHTDLTRTAEAFAKIEYEKNDPAHRWPHVQNVLERASAIARRFENVDFEALKLAIFFHDIDYRSYEQHVDASVKIAEEFLKKNNCPKGRIEKVKEIMRNHSTPHRKKMGEARLLEGKIIYDADKSILMTSPESYEKYFHKLYLDETKKLVKEKLGR